MNEEGSDIHKHHVETYGDPSQFGNKDFVPMFKAEKYDPDDKEIRKEYLSRKWDIFDPEYADL